MMIAPSATAPVDGLLASLDPEQRAAAMLPDGPAQIIAPAGSGKTTTRVARLAVLLERGVAPERICVVTFNRDAALDLAARVERRLGPTFPRPRRSKSAPSTPWRARSCSTPARAGTSWPTAFAAAGARQPLAGERPDPLLRRVDLSVTASS